MTSVIHGCIQYYSSFKTLAPAMILLFVLNNNTSLELSCPLQEGMENGIALDLTT